MTVSFNNTQVVFNDATTQTTSGVTVVNVSTGISSTGGKTPTLTNTGVTSLTAGTGISLSGSTGAITVTNTAGGVTSAVAGNGVAVSAATGAVTFSASCPTFNSVGSYCCGFGFDSITGFNFTSGNNYSAGSGNGQAQTGLVSFDNLNGLVLRGSNNLSGTWKWLGASHSTISGFGDTAMLGLMCRVS